MSEFCVSQEQTLAYLRQLVAIDSINPDLVEGGVGEGAISAKLAGICQALGLGVDLQEVAPGRPNLIARWPGRGDGKSLLLTGHTDIVGVAEMTQDPFSPRIHDGRLYGRGAYDMKGGLAAILGAVAALKASNYRPRGDIWLGFVCDEEYVSIGTEALVQRLQPDAAILTEPTDEIISIAHRGFAWLTITTHGTAAHGSDYEQGVDAIQHLAPVLEHITRLENEIYPQRQHPLLGRHSVHASLVHGGRGLSTYPDRCVLRIEHRTLPGEDGAQLLAEWQDYLQQLTLKRDRFHAEVLLDFERPPLEIAPSEPIVSALASAFATQLGAEPPLGASFGWLDSAILVAAGIPTAIFGPSGAGAHAAEEWVDLASVYRCSAVLAECCARWCA